MTVQEFYNFVKKHNKLDAEMRVIREPYNWRSKGIVVNEHMIDIICNRDKETKEKKFTVVIG